MGLVKQKSTHLAGRSKPEPGLDCNHLGAALEGADAGGRRQAARDIARCPDAARALIARLKREEDAAVREVILNTLVRLKDTSIVDGLAECLRSENSALRNATIEAFQQLGHEVDPILESLLADPDPDLRIFVVNILESQRYSGAENWLIKIIEEDSHVNVCAMALDLLCEVGTEASSAALLRLKARFAPEPYIQFAADLALKRIREI
jgi:HEAT repeat protein